MEVLAGRRQPALPVFNVEVEEGVRLPHVCATPGQGYALRMVNDSRRHIACNIAVDGENAILKDGSFIVAPGDSRELPGFLVSKNFVGREYVKEYRDFVFGKPKVVEKEAMAVQAAGAPAEYTAFGRVVCDVYEAELDEEVGSDEELRGQTSHFRNGGLHGGPEDRSVPEGKKTHLLYSSVTVGGARSTIANATRGRWWIRGRRKLRTLEVRYRELHSLLLLGVEVAKLEGGAECKDEGPGDGSVKVEGKDSKAEKSEKKEEQEKVPFLPRSGPGPGLVDVCDLTCEDGGDAALWTVKSVKSAKAVEVDAEA